MLDAANELARETLGGRRIRAAKAPEVRMLL